MGRPLEIHFDGANYHLIQRGHNKSYIFEDVKDKLKFFDLLMESRDRFLFDILYYVLMTNHFHILLQVGEYPLSQIMQVFKPAYTRYYNYRHDRVNTIFDGRYKAPLIRHENYFKLLLRYIAYNPVKAGIVSCPGKYPWSAHADILKGKSSLVNIDQLLKHFDDDPRIALERYIDFIDYPHAGIVQAPPSAGAIVEPAANYLHYQLENMKLPQRDLELLFNGSRGIRIIKLRKMFIKQAFDAGHSVQAISRFLAMNSEDVAKMLMQGGV